MTSNFMKCAALGWVLAMGPASGQSADEELRALRKDVEALRASQMEMQKNLQIVKDILMGKQPPLENVFVNTAGAPSMGANDAKVTMVEFSDFQCPFCGRYANQTMAKVIDEYVKTGKVRYIFRNFPLEQIHPLALKAAEAADCANEQGKFWEAHDRFFQNQKTLDGKEWEAHALGLGLDAPKFQQCIDSGKFTQQVKADEAEGTMLAIKGTPTFFFGRTDGKNGGKLKAVKLLSGAVPFEKFKEIIDVLLNPAKDEKDTEDSNR